MESVYKGKLIMFPCFPLFMLTFAEHDITCHLENLLCPLSNWAKNRSLGDTSAVCLTSVSKGN